MTCEASMCLRFLGKGQPPRPHDLRRSTNCAGVQLSGCKAVQANTASLHPKVSVPSMKPTLNSPWVSTEVWRPALLNDRLQPSADVGRGEKDRRVAPGNRTVRVRHTIGYAVQHCLDPVARELQHLKKEIIGEKQQQLPDQAA